MDNSNPNVPSRDAAQAKWLASVGFLLAVLLELFPTEMRVMYGPALDAGGISLFLVVKTTCLAIIFAPFLVYVRMNGWQALRCVRTRVTFVGVIVFIRLVQDVPAVLGSLLGRIR
jgi:hypothetical protein